MLARPKIQRILFATDFLASSRLALDYAVAFAQHFKAAIVMLHALELSYPASEAETETSRPSFTRKHAEERLQAVADSIQYGGVKVEQVIEEGIPEEVIPRAIEDQSADLLVIGVHGVHRGFEHLLVGSNTEKILLSTSCPTMTVGAHALTGVNPGLHFKEILYFADFTPEAAAAAPYAAFLGKEFQAPVDVCQLLPEMASDNPELRNTLAEEYCDAIRRVYPDSDPGWCTPAFHLDRGREFNELIDRAQTQHAGLIILGTHTESHLGRHLHTTFAYQLLSKASCPVISIRLSTPGYS